MANTRKPIKRKKINRRVVRQTREITKLDTHFIALHEAFIAARRAGFDKEMAFWIMQEPNALPDWIANTKSDAIIPRIDPDDEDDD